ncbi:MmgE/PrpD family protein [Yaniella flava]|uniref:MmgE/PrpD family protein n=1 Tax=Yaniella flava TaxID=287930 RepID=A0ABP5GGC6_9MICC
MSGSAVNQDHLNELAEFIENVSFQNIPPSLSRKIHLHIVDTLTVALLGAETDLSIKCQETFPTHNSRLNGVSSPLWGTDRWADPAISAFNNAIRSHVLELDDSHGCDHSGAVVVPAVMSVAAQVQELPSLNDLVAAVVVGYEVARRTQTALGGYKALNDRGWHSTAVCGPFGAAAAASHVMRLPKKQIASALSLTTSKAAGTWAYSSGGGDAKALHAGLASKNGVEAALLAKHGVEGSADVFRDVWGGFLKMYSGTQDDAHHLTRKLGEDWLARNSRIKLYSSCASVHPVLEALEKFRKQRPDIFEGGLPKVEVFVSESVSRMCGSNVFDALSSRTARQLSLPYSLALVILKGQPELQDYLDPKTKPEVMKDILRQITVVPDQINTDPSGHGTVIIHSHGEQHTVHTTTEYDTSVVEDAEPLLLQKLSWIGSYLNDEDRVAKLTSLILNPEDSMTFLDEAFSLLHVDK